MDIKDRGKKGATNLPTGVRGSFSHGRSNTVLVEVRKRRLLGEPSDTGKPDSDSYVPNTSVIGLAATLLASKLRDEGREQDARIVDDRLLAQDWEGLRSLLQEKPSDPAPRVIQFDRLDHIFTDENVDSIFKEAGFSTSELTAAKPQFLRFISGLVDEGIIHAGLQPEQIQSVLTGAVALLKRIPPAQSFQQAASVKLPDEAPAKWENADERLPEETPIAFLRRVWGSYLDAGVLYQDDIKRLGDAKLIPAIRSYCQNHPEWKAAEVLPPPRQARTDKTARNAPADSAESILARRAVRNREAMAHRRTKPT